MPYNGSYLRLFEKDNENVKFHITFLTLNKHQHLLNSVLH